MCYWIYFRCSVNKNSFPLLAFYFSCHFPVSVSISFYACLLSWRRLSSSLIIACLLSTFFSDIRHPILLLFQGCFLHAYFLILGGKLHFLSMPHLSAGSHWLLSISLVPFSSILAAWHFPPYWSATWEEKFSLSRSGGEWSFHLRQV